MFSLIEKGVIFFLGLAFLAASLFGTALSLPLQSFALILLSIGSLCAAIYLFKYGSVPKPYLLLGVMLALLYFGARAYFSPVADFGRDDLFLILGAGSFYLVGGYFCAVPRLRITIAYTVIVALGLHMASAVMQVNGEAGFWPLQWFADITKPKGSVVSGMYGYRGSFANFVAIASMLALSLAILGRYHSVIRGVFLLLGVCGMGGVVISGSRSAIVSLVIGGLVLVCLLWVASSAQTGKYKKYLRIGIVAMGALSLIGGPYAVYHVFSQRAYGEEVGSDVLFSDSSRSSYWPMAISQISESVWIGGGSRSFSYENYKYWNPNLRIVSANPEFVHNEYLQVATDYGLLGLVIVLSIIVAHLVIGIKRTCEVTSKMIGCNASYSNDLALCVAGIVGIVIMGVHVIFDFRTHLQANLLLVTSCLFWVLPVRVTQPLSAAAGAWVVKVVYAVILISLSLFSGRMAVKELQAGIPLLEAKLAFETSNWNVSEINKEAKVSALEESINLSPSFRRYFKLATIYHARSGSEDYSESEQRDFLNQAYDHYKQAELRHPYDPGIQSNLGVVAGRMRLYSESTEYFREALLLSKNRGDYWFKIRLSWSQVFFQKALEHWAKSEVELAMESFSEAYKVLEASQVHKGESRNTYLAIASEHVKLLVAQNNFSTADLLIEKLGSYKISHRSSFNHLDLAEYYYAKGMYVWYERMPEEAASCFLKSRRYYIRYKRAVKGSVDDHWKKGFGLVEERLAFFKKTNIKSKEN